MRLYLIVLSAFFLMLMSCGGNKTSQTEDERVEDSTQVMDSMAVDSLEEAVAPMPQAADELFDDFIFNFASSRKLQMERIVFPLPVYQDNQKKMIKRKDWKTEHFFMQQGFYTLLFDSEQQMEVVKDTTVSHAMIEKVLLADSKVTQYVFDRLHGKWKMTSLHVVPVDQAFNASFLNFYHHFVNDKEFQLKSLSETVDFVGPDPDDDFSQMEGVITSDTWEAFAPELPSDMFYNIVYGKARKECGEKVLVLRGIANGFELRMTFRLKGDTWKLTKLIT